VTGARLSPRRAAEGQRVWVAFAEVRHHWWQRLLRRGFRHCFAAIEEPDGSWIVVEPLSGRLLVTRPEVPAGFDLPGFWRRSGLIVTGPHRPRGPQLGARPGLGIATVNCVNVTRALLGAGAPQAWTPAGLHRALTNPTQYRKKDLTDANKSL